MRVLGKVRDCSITNSINAMNITNMYDLTKNNVLESRICWDQAPDVETQSTIGHPEVFQLKQNIRDEIIYSLISSFFQQSRMMLFHF